MKSILVDDALAKVSDLGTVGAMKWLENELRTSLQNAYIPEGYALVPLRPTDAMLDAINDAPWYIEESVHWNGEALIRKQITRPNARYIIDGWDAMLKAASKSNQEISPQKEGA